MMKFRLKKTKEHENAAINAAVAVSAPALVAAPAVVTIGLEQAHDVSAREKILDIAMGPNRKRKSSEKIRRGRLPAEGLALGAHTDKGELVGTVRLWDISAGLRDGAKVPALLVGPLAVHPDFEGQGIGSKLMRQALKTAQELGHGAVLLVGDPEYYHRFGFSNGLTENLSMPGPYEKHRFQAVEFKPDYLKGAKGVLKATGRKANKPS